MKFIQSFVLALIVLAATASNVYSQANTSESDSLKTVTVKVKGITCSTDVKTISANVEKVKGVSSCKVAKQGATTSFEVAFNKSKVTEKEIFSAIENTGGCENPNDRPYKVKQ